MSDVHVELQEWQQAGPGTGRDVSGLRGFGFDSSADRALAEQLSNAGALTFHERYDGLQICARAHVGRIRLGSLTVTVMPKIGSRDLLALFRYAYGLRDLKWMDSIARYAVTGSLLQDLLIAQLHGEVRVLLERGVARRYVPCDERLQSPRGKVDFARLAVSGARADIRLPCRHFPRDSDHLLNRAVLAGLQYARGLTQAPRLRIDLARSHATLAELAQPEPLTADLLRRAVRDLDRQLVHYRPVLALIELLFAGQALDLGADTGNVSLPGFLFDMNRFFQQLMLRFLSEHLEAPFRVQSEHALSEMLRYLPGENPRRARAPTPRPDYAIIEGKRVVTLLDAKYRDLWDRPLPREMLYQLSIYALSQPRGSTAAILYPTTDPSARAARIEIRDPTSSATAGYVALRPVLLSRMVECLEAMSASRVGVGRQLAQELVWGSAAVSRARREQRDSDPDRELGATQRDFLGFNT